MTWFHGEFCSFDFCSPSSCAALLPKKSFGRELSFSQVRSPVTILLWCPADGRHDEPQSPKGIPWNWAALCSFSAFLQQHSCSPIHLPLDQGRSAFRDACPSVKREKKEKGTLHPLQVSPTQSCLLGKQTLHPQRGLSTFWGCTRKCWMCSSCSMLVGWVQ